MENILCRIFLEGPHKLSLGKILVAEIVSDDDLTLRKHCTSPDKEGGLNEGVRALKFYADPSHRSKVWIKSKFKMAKNTNKRDELKKVDVMRLKKYINCYVAQYRTDNFDYICRNTLAALEYLFDSHLFCDKQWCYYKELEFRTQQIIEHARNENVTFS